MHMASVLGHLHLVSAVTSHVLGIFSILGFPPQPRHHLCSFMHSSPKRSIQKIWPCYILPGLFDFFYGTLLQGPVTWGLHICPYSQHHLDNIKFCYHLETWLGLLLVTATVATEFQHNWTWGNICLLISESPGICLSSLHPELSDSKPMPPCLAISFYVDSEYRIQVLMFV